MVSMLPDSGGSVSNHLQRTKSLTSVKERRKHPLLARPVDPRIARNHAVIAAHRAVDRSRASGSTDLTYSESVVSRNTDSSRKEQSVTFSPANHLQRQRSTLQDGTHSQAETSQDPKVAFGVRGNDNYLGLGSEFGYEGENYGAEPSSYRKLRQSRSLLSPVRRVQVPQSCSSETYLSSTHTLRKTTSSAALQSPSFKVRLKKSFSFLRQPYSVPDPIVSASAPIRGDQTDHSPVVALARAQFLQNHNQQQATRSPSSPLKGSKKDKAQTAFRKSLRPTEFVDNGTNDCVRDSKDLSVAEPGRRSMSATLGKRLKRIFGRSKQHGRIPPQQLEASRPRFGLDFKSPESGFDRYLEPNPESVTGASLEETPNVHLEKCGDVAQPLKRASQSGSSSDSLTSISRSRVTSWTNSTASGSGSVVIKLPECDTKRLSVIKEDGVPYQPSSSAGRHIGGVLAFQQPLDLPKGQKINSQRIYSALLKRIDEEEAQMSKTQAALEEIHPARERHVGFTGHSSSLAPTIRRVESEGVTGLTDITELDSDTNSQSPYHQTISDLNRQPRQPAIRDTLQQRDARSDFSPAALTDLKISKPDLFWQTHAEEEPRQTFRVVHETHPKPNRTVVRSNDPSRYSNKNKSMSSTDSIYSRTTDGDTNSDYISPVASTESFPLQASQGANITGILHSKNPEDLSVTAARQPAGRAIRAQGSLLLGQRSWLGRTENQIMDLRSGKAGLRKAMHIREGAQIDSDDTEVGDLARRLWSSQAIPNELEDTSPDKPLDADTSLDGRIQLNSTVRIKKRPSRFLRLKEVSQNCTPVPTRSVSLKRSQSALINQTNKIEPGQPEEPQFSRLRRISSGNVLNMLKTRRSQPAFKAQPESSKENHPIDGDQFPRLMSTVGRHRHQMPNGSLSERHRSGQNVVGSPKDKQDLKEDDRCDTFQGSPPNYSRSAISSSRRRPISRDIAARDRSFKSTQLGQRETEDENWLGVAINSPVTRPKKKKTYGDLGPPPSFAARNCPGTDDDGEAAPTTALPVLPENNRLQRSVSGLSLRKSKVRIAGTILGRRRVRDENDERSHTGSPAFV